MSSEHAAAAPPPALAAREASWRNARRKAPVLCHLYRLPVPGSAHVAGLARSTASACLRTSYGAFGCTTCTRNTLSAAVVQLRASPAVTGVGARRWSRSRAQCAAQCRGRCRRGCHPQRFATCQTSCTKSGRLRRSRLSRRVNCSTARRVRPCRCVRLKPSLSPAQATKALAAAGDLISVVRGRPTLRPHCLSTPCFCVPDAPRCVCQGALIDLLVDEYALSPQANHRKARRRRQRTPYGACSDPPVPTRRAASLGWRLPLWACPLTTSRF